MYIPYGNVSAAKFSEARPLAPGEAPDRETPLGRNPDHDEL